jgi:hypothetical protein
MRIQNEKKAGAFVAQANLVNAIASAEGGM